MVRPKDVTKMGGNISMTEESMAFTEPNLEPRCREDVLPTNTLITKTDPVGHKMTGGYANANFVFLLSTSLTPLTIIGCVRM